MNTSHKLVSKVIANFGYHLWVYGWYAHFGECPFYSPSWQLYVILRKAATEALETQHCGHCWSIGQLYIFLQYWMAQLIWNKVPHQWHEKLHIFPCLEQCKTWLNFLRVICQKSKTIFAVDWCVWSSRLDARPGKGCPTIDIIVEQINSTTTWAWHATDTQPLTNWDKLELWLSFTHHVLIKTECVSSLFYVTQWIKNILNPY